MTAPKRIQRRRMSGWRKPDGAVIVDRTTRHWGNPFTVEWVRRGNAPDLSNTDARRIAVHTFAHWLDDDGYAALFPVLLERRRWILDHVHELAGKDVVCFCPEPEDGQPDHCHGRVLMDLAAKAKQDALSGGAG